MIPQSFIQDLLNRLDVVDVIERYIPLKRAGANYVACCPFHSEKTPSFSVSPTKQFYHCFGCGAHGTAISFVMEYAGLGFVEAVKELAASVGMTVPEEQRDAVQQRSQDDVEVLYQVMQSAMQYYRGQLKLAQPAIAYLKGRGLSGEIAARFGIGYAPAGWQNLAAVFPDYNAKSLLQAGLVIESEEGRRYDRFRDRIMFPIQNQRGRVIGFGGRVLGSGEPKYLNSPETPLFEKGQELYGLTQARKAIREAGRVMVVEGYMDVVALAQHGVEYAVATLGTATTPIHVQKLLRQSDEIVFCFDGDAAGRRAAWRALENSLEALVDGKTISFLFLPQGEDPDSYVRQVGREGFEALLQNEGVPLSTFLLRELSARVDMQSQEGRASLLQHARPLLGRIHAPALSLILRKRLAELAGVSQSELEDLFQIKRQAPERQRPQRVSRKQPSSPLRRLMQSILVAPRLAQEVEIGLLDTSVEDGAAAVALLEFVRSHPQLSHTGAMVQMLANTPHEQLFRALAAEVMAWDEGVDIEAEFHGVLKQLEDAKRNRRIQELLTLSQNGGLNAEGKAELARLLQRGTVADIK